MTVQVNAPFTVSDGLQALIEEKVNKLTSYFEKIESVTIFFRNHDHRSQSTPTGLSAEIRLNVPGQILYAEENSDSFEKSLTAAAEKMRKQLIRYKEQLTSHH